MDPDAPRTIAYIDGTSLMLGVRAAFGHRFPLCDPYVLARKLCERLDWSLVHTRFYASIPSLDDDAESFDWWNNLVSGLELAGVWTWTRLQEARTVNVPLPEGGFATRRVLLSKGVTVRIALDAIRIQNAGAQDVALFLSQDPDLAEVADELRAVAEGQGRALKVASAYPYTITNRGARGVPRTDHVRVERALYESCVGRRY